MLKYMFNCLPAVDNLQPILSSYVFIQLKLVYNNKYDLFLPYIFNVYLDVISIYCAPVTVEGDVNSSLVRFFFLSKKENYVWLL